MVLTKDQKRLLKLASKEINSVLKENGKSDELHVSWQLWFAYDATSNVYHQIQDSMKYTLNQIRTKLSEKADNEWKELKREEAGFKTGKVPENILDQQRARWAAWDRAAAFTKGDEDI